MIKFNKMNYRIKIKRIKNVKVKAPTEVGALVLAKP